MISNQIPQIFNKEEQEKVIAIFNTYFVDSQICDRFDDLVREDQVIDIQIVLKTVQVLNIFGGFICSYQSQKQSRKLTPDDYNKILMLAILWGIGGSYELEQRKKLEDLIKEVKGS